MALDAQLLDILVCPEDKGPLLYFEDDGFLYNPRLQPQVRGPRRHPDHAGRRSRRGHRRRAPDAVGRGRGVDPAPARADRWRRSGGPGGPDRLDSLGMFDVAAALPEQVADGRRGGRGRAARFPSTTTSPTCVVLGMGGSGIAGDLLAAVAGPLHAGARGGAQGLRAPAFVDRSTLVFAVSFSGNTEETLEAVQRGPAGRRPRARGHATAASSPGWRPSGARPACRCPTTSPCRGPRSARCPSRCSSCSSASACFPGATGWVHLRRRAAAAPARPAGGGEQPGGGAGPQARPHHAAGVGRRGPRRRGRGALEGAAERERQGAGLRQRGARSCATTRSAAAARTATSPGRCSRCCSSATTTSTPRWRGASRWSPTSSTRSWPACTRCAPRATARWRSCSTWCSWATS